MPETYIILLTNVTPINYITLNQVKLKPTNRFELSALHTHSQQGGAQPVISGRS